LKNKDKTKLVFKKRLKEFINSLNVYVSSKDKQWTIKGFIDIYKNIYGISSDTKIVSKILEIHLFPKILEFAEKYNYKVVLADHQNYYPDFSFVSNDDEAVKFAVDLKTTYRSPENPDFCNGFTLGSHGQYFIDRTSRKNIQFPYDDYLGHFCLGVIYTRNDVTEEGQPRIYKLDELKSIVSVISDFQFFAAEKWEIASDSSGSGNTANIGSIIRISDILEGMGVFKRLGEKWFDEYWMNYGKITIKLGREKKKITKLVDFLKYRGKNPDLANPIVRSKKRND
jgi:hypothetical protein